MDADIQGMFEKILSPKVPYGRELTVAEVSPCYCSNKYANRCLIRRRSTPMRSTWPKTPGIIFLDEIDKVVASESKSADVSRQGVQRDLLPLVEGTTVQTRYGYIKTRPRSVRGREARFIEESHQT